MLLGVSWAKFEGREVVGHTGVGLPGNVISLTLEFATVHPVNWKMKTGLRRGLWVWAGVQQKRCQQTEHKYNAQERAHACLGDQRLQMPS